MVHPGTIYFERAILLSRFGYWDQLDSVYWCQQVLWERRNRSELERVVPYHMCCSYNLRETALDRLLVGIPSDFARRVMCHGFLLAQYFIFSYKYIELIDDGYMGLWVVACTERVVRV